MDERTINRVQGNLFFKTLVQEFPKSLTVWEDLQHKVKTTDYDAYHKKIKLYYETHKASQIQKWQKTLDDLRENTQ